MNNNENIGFFSSHYKRLYPDRDSQIKMFFDELFTSKDVYKLLNDFEDDKYNSISFLWKKLNEIINYIIVSNMSVISLDFKEVILLGFKTLIRYKKFLMAHKINEPIKEKDCKDVLDFMKNLLVKKNQDYGDSFGKSVKKFGIVYAAIEIDKKKNRLYNLLKSSNGINYEGIDDTITDIIGYFILAYLFLSFDK